MFTVEYEMDEICVTILDDTNQFGDLKIHSFEDTTFITQYDEETNVHSILQISNNQFTDLINSLNTTEGAYITATK